MSDQIFEAFSNFIRFATSDLTGTRSGGPSLVDHEQLPKAVDNLEKCEEFFNLVRVTRATFSSDFHQTSSEQNWVPPVHNFFCQSGCYLELWLGHSVDINSLSISYRNSFEEKESEITYLAPINLVSFDIKSGMDFDSFRIRRFSEQELSGLIRNRLNLIFYPYSAFNERQVTLLSQLSQYFFLCCTVKESVEQIGHIYFAHSPLTTLIFSGEAERWYTDFPEPIESALRSLSLYDWKRTNKNSHNNRRWNSKDDWESLRLPDIPFVLKVRRSPLWSPQTIPDFSKLITTPFTDPYTEEVEEPENWFSLTKEETYRFNVFVRKTNLILIHLNTKENDWDFINIALGYFLKAFIGSPDLDQMLWFITSFEALVGERPKGVTGGVTERLIRRLSIILNKDIGMDENEVRERFERIYDLRSCLVHGGRFEKQPHRNDIIDARLIARRAILWFLNALELVQTAISNGTIKNNDVKGHERILAEMDLYPQSKGALALVLGQLMIGTVDNFFSHLYVASIDLNNTLKKGEPIHIMGHTTNILLRVESIQVEHKEVNEAAAGQTIGIKVADRVRVGDRVFRVISDSS